MVNPQAKELMDVKVQDQKIFDRFFDISGIIHFEFVSKETTVN
jgi:hypothetical protein